MKVFIDIKLQPAYGFNQILVHWILRPGLAGGKMFIYRSPDGIDQSDSWILLNENNPVTNLSFYIDNSFEDTTKFRHYYYRLVYLYDSKYYDSPIIGMFSEGLNKTEYGILRHMRSTEYLRMRSRNGVRVLHCIPKLEGSFSDSADQVLMARTGVACKIDPESPANEEGNGLFSKEFSNIVQTWCEIVSVGDITATPDEGGAMDRINQVYKLRLLGFPTPEIGHMLVFPNSDKRLNITNNITPFLFKGYLPVAYEVMAEEIPRTESRYKIPMPLVSNDADQPIYIDTAI